MALYSAIQRFITKNGLPVEGASCLVLQDGAASTQPTLYATRTGGAKSNPFLTDAQGKALCFVPAGRYKMIVTKDAEQVTFEGIEVGPVSSVGTFVDGCTITDPDQWVADSDGALWQYIGDVANFPLTVTPGFAPDSEWREVVPNGGRSVASVDALRSTRLRFNGEVLWLTGYYDGSYIGAGPVVGTFAEAPTDDSGVNFAGDGVQWARQLDGFVTPEMFGARSGFESFANILAMHTFANLNNMEVKARGAYIVTANQKIPVKTNCDYKTAKFIIPDGVVLSEIFEIKPTIAVETITPPATNFVKGRTVLPDVASYPKSLIAIDSPDTYILRNGTDVVRKRDVVYHSEDGKLSHALFFTMSAISGVFINKAEDYVLEFYAPSLEVANCALTNFITSRRNQVTVYGAAVTNGRTDAGAPIVTYFNPQLCMLNTLDGKFRDELSGFSGLNGSTYDFSGGSVLYPTVRNIVNGSEWGAIDGNVYRDLLVDRCIVSRVGCHASAVNVTVRDTTLTAKCVQVTGGGLLKLERVTKTVQGVGGTLGFVNALVDLREDYGGEWDGDIEIDGFTIECGNFAFTDAELAIVKTNFKGDVDYGKDLNMPRRISIKNGEIIASSSASTDSKMYLVETFRYTQNQQFNERTLPELIDLKDISVTVPSGSALQRVLPYRSPKIDSPNVQGSVKIVSNNAGLKLNVSALPLAQGGRNLRVEATTTEMDNVTHSEHYVFKNMNVDAIFRAPANWSLSCRYADVYNFDNFFNSIQGRGFTEARDCNLYPGRYSGTAPKAYYNCTAKIGGGSAAVQLSGGFVRAVGNSIASGVVMTLASPRTKTEFVNGYYDATYYEPL